MYTVIQGTKFLATVLTVAPVTALHKTRIWYATVHALTAENNNLLIALEL